MPDPCACGACPRPPQDRPATKQEVVQYWEHRYPHWPKQKLYVLAIEQYTHGYSVWVNARAWRKPPEWTGGRVPRHLIRSKPMFREEVQAWRQRLLAELRRNLDERSAASA